MDDEMNRSGMDEWNTEQTGMENMTDGLLNEAEPSAEDMSGAHLSDEIHSEENPFGEIPSEDISGDEPAEAFPSGDQKAQEDFGNEAAGDAANLAEEEKTSPDSVRKEAAGNVPPQDKPHDFDVEEPRYDTQTGERLDRPKKKYPGIILTMVVSALAVGAFIYAVLPGRLPSAVNPKDEEVENETVLAIASTEVETEAASSAAEQTEAEAQAESEAQVFISALREEDTEVQTETEMTAETETETEAETEAGAAAGKDDSEQEQKNEKPEFKTEGVILSASLDVSDMVEEVMPGIVSITCTNIKTVQDFFYGRQQIKQTDACSGIIVDEDDDAYYIVTEAWIVSGAQEVTVGFSVSKKATEGISDEDTLAQAVVAGADPETGLALIMVEKDSVHETVREQVRPSVLGDSDAIRVGERAIAIGNAMGCGLSVTEGIFSALNRQMQNAAGIHSYIQTDASINYGNYGGALLNAAGEVIGINAGKISRDSGEGMGYAFPINSAKEAIAQMIGERGSVVSGAAQTEVKEAEEQTEENDSNKAVLQVAEPETEETQAAEETEESRSEEKETQAPAGGQETEEKDSGSGSGQGGVLGVNVADVSDEYSIIYRVPKGAYIAGIVDGSGAEAAGLHEGDVIVGVNDSDITEVAQLKEALSSARAGDKVKITYVRPDGEGNYEEDRTSSVTVTLQ